MTEEGVSEGQAEDGAAAIGVAALQATTPAVQKPRQDVEPSPAQAQLSTAGAASLASASSLTPNLLARPSLKSNATQSPGQSQRSPPSLLIHLTESTHSIRLSPSPSRPRSVVSFHTDDGVNELAFPDNFDHSKQLDERSKAGELSQDTATRTQFLTKRLRSAIGEDIIFRDPTPESPASSSAVDRLESMASTSEVSAQQQNGAMTSTLRGEEEATSGTGWNWGAITNLPSALRLDGAMNAFKRGEATSSSSSPAPTVEPAVKKQAEVAKNGSGDGSSFGAYVKPLDVRKWWAPASSSSRSSSRERPPSSASRSGAESPRNSKGKTRPEDASGKGASTVAEPTSPLKGFPVGSFPSSSVAKRNKKKREQALLSQAKGRDLTSEDDNRPVSAVSARGKEGPDIREHDLTDRQFGIGGQDGDAFPERQYLVLSTAGKPIFVSYVSKARLQRAAESKARHQKRRQKGTQQDEAEEEEEEEKALAAQDQALQDDEDQRSATTVGVLQALISNYESAGPEELQRKSLTILELPEGSRICYFLRPPLYLAAISRWGEDESTLTNHLEYLYLSILSLVSASKLHRLFDRAANFDLKRLLDGTDGILDSLLTNLQSLASPLYDSLPPIRIDASLRSEAGAALVPSKDKVRPQDALYAVLSTPHGLVTLAKRKKKGIHPIDCHLLVNTVFATKAMKEVGTQSWVPICLPKFAPQGYLYAHVSFLLDRGGKGEEEDGTRVNDFVERKEGEQEGNKVETESRNSGSELALILVTSNPDGFEEMSAWRDSIVESLQSPDSRLLTRLAQSIQPAQSTYNVDELRCPGLRHFLFKWRTNLQSTSPQFEDPYAVGSDDQKRLISLYGIAQECIYRRRAAAAPPTILSPAPPSGSSPSSPVIKPKSVLADTSKPKSSSAAAAAGGKGGGGNAPPPSSSSSPSLALKRKSIITGQHLLKTSSEFVFAWSTPSFELYLAVGTHLPRNAIINIAKSIVKWVKQEESRLFIANPSVFE